MESYIVRIYRRGHNDSDEIAGLVETVGTDEKRAFKSFSGLVAARRALDEEDHSGDGVETQARIYTDDQQTLRKRHGS
jgi:hypothetical protein